MSQRGGVWSPYIWVALGIAVTSGFGLGGALFAALASGVPAGVWWLALAQAHGHSQLFGYVGLLVLGTLLHFLPRLRGAPLWHPRAAMVALGCYTAGLAVRVIAQPGVALRATPAIIWRAALLLSGWLELCGGAVALVLLLVTVRRGPALATRPGFREVAPFLAVAALAFTGALLVNTGGTFIAATTAGGLVPAWPDYWTARLFLDAALVPIAVAMSSRLFALYFRAPLPRMRPLRAGLVLLLAGLAAGSPGLPPPWPALGALSRGVALLVVLWGTAIFAQRRPLPRGQPLPRDAVWYHALAASGWLAVTAFVLLAGALRAMGAPGPAVPASLETHLLGAGYLTLLILGIGAKLLPGFAGRPLRSQALVWFTLVAGNLAALLRAGPLVLPAVLPAPGRDLLLALAGLSGAAALAAFGWNLSGPVPRARARSPGVR